MKVLLVTPFPPPMGGISNWSKLVYNYITENEKDIDIRYINISPKKRTTEGRTFFDRIFFGFLSILSTSKKLKKEIREFKPDVVHINTSGSLALFRDIKLLKILKRKKIKSVLHLRFGRVPELLEHNCNESRLIKRAFKYANKILSIDGKTYNYLNKDYSNKSLICPNPFVCDKMPKQISIKKDNILRRVTYLGWVVNTKGIEELISAWSYIHVKYPDWKLQIVGPCNKKYFDYLEKNFSLNGIDFLGEKSHEDAMDIMNNSDIFTLPSYTEGFPNVVLEAMYLGKAIVATDVGAIPDMLSNNSGIVIESKNVEKLREAFEKLITNEELIYELGKNAQNKSKMYLIENVIEQYKKIWF